MGGCGSVLAVVVLTVLAVALLGSGNAGAIVIGVGVLACLGLVRKRSAL